MDRAKALRARYEAIKWKVLVRAILIGSIVLIFLLVLYQVETTDINAPFSGVF